MDRLDLAVLDNDIHSLIAHLSRYAFVCRQIKPDERIIDVGCGTGYGSFFLARQCSKGTVTGFDPEIDALFAADRYKLPNLRFTNLLAGIETFDVIVCFEVIEHLHKDEGKTFVGWLRSLGHAQSRWFISTPRRLPANKKSQNRNRWHKYEYGYNSFYALLRANFRQVFVFAQNDAIISSQNPEMGWNFVAIATL